MKTLLFLLLSVPGAYGTTAAQSFTGHWKGTITRDFGNESKTDSIELQLEQTGDDVKGYSILYTSAEHFIRSAIKGSFQQSSKLLRLSETRVVLSNIPNWRQDVFLDCYLLNFDENQADSLSGKTVPYHSKAGYTRSRMLLKKE